MGTCKVSIFDVFFIFNGVVSVPLRDSGEGRAGRGASASLLRRCDWMDIVLIDLFLFCIELLCCDSKKKKEKEGEYFRFEARVLWLVGFWRVSSLQLYRTSEL